MAAITVPEAGATICVLLRNYAHQKLDEIICAIENDAAKAKDIDAAVREIRYALRAYASPLLGGERAEVVTHAA